MTTGGSQDNGLKGQLLLPSLDLALSLERARPVGIARRKKTVVQPQRSRSWTLPLWNVSPETHTHTLTDTPHHRFPSACMTCPVHIAGTWQESSPQDVRKCGSGRVGSGRRRVEEDSGGWRRGACVRVALACVRAAKGWAGKLSSEGFPSGRFSSGLKPHGQWPVSGVSLPPTRAVDMHRWTVQCRNFFFAPGASGRPDSCAQQILTSAASERARYLMDPGPVPGVSRPRTRGVRMLGYADGCSYCPLKALLQERTLEFRFFSFGLS